MVSAAFGPAADRCKAGSMALKTKRTVIKSMDFSGTTACSQKQQESPQFNTLPAECMGVATLGASWL